LQVAFFVRREAHRQCLGLNRQIVFRFVVTLKNSPKSRSILRGFIEERAMLINGWEWDEAVIGPGDPLNAGLLSLMVIGHDKIPILIGSAFLVTADGHKATAVSAAHCFTHIESILHPNKRHHPTTPLEFLPPPSEVDLKQVKAVYIKDAQAHVCPIEIAIWDTGTDLATLTVVAPLDDPNLFQSFFWIDGKIPNVSEQVVMVGFGEMSVVPNQDNQQQGRMLRRLVVRVGYVEEVFPEASYLLKSPSVHTSIAVFSGMSGGLVARYAPPKTIKPFAFISHSLDQPLFDRSMSGHSVGSVLKAKLTLLEDRKQLVEIEVNNVGVGRTDPQLRDTDS
jgi:hypothetical protein